LEYAKAWSQPSAIEYYSKHRREVSDLYPSERVFLPRVLFPGIKVLDVGCASGGFFNIMRALEPTIDYTGIDIAEPAVDLARRTYQEARFEVADGVTIPFDDGTFDLVHCTSVLVIEPRYQEVWKEMYRVTSRFVLADMRLLKDIEGQGGLQDSHYRIQFDGQEQEAVVPYVVSDADEVISFLLDLEPRPRALRGTGYFHEVSEMADTCYSQVCMSILLVEKGNLETTQTELDLDDLPLEFSAFPVRTATKE
jgi:SAM-dependent methyltransferase